MRKRADFLIGLRRHNEERRQDYAAAHNRDTNAGMVAAWENKTDRMIGIRKNMDQIDRIQAKHAQTLEERRARLAQLLAAEQEEYDKAVEGLVETQEQRREKMAAKALELRNNREAKRQEFAQKQQDRAFQASCDVLREAISRNTTLQVASDRMSQIELNAQRRRQQAEEDRFFDEMWEIERMKKIQRAKEDMERVKKMNIQLRDNLSRQLDIYNRAKAEEKALKEEEDRIYKEQIQLQLAMDAQREKERRAERVALGRRNKEFNVALRKQKEESAKKEKDEDIKLLNDLLTKIRDEEARDQEMKVHMRKEALEYMEALRDQMGQDAENDAELERLWAQENEKEWAKREARWKADQEARENLLKEVFEERQLQLELKRRNMERSKQNKADERAAMLAEMEALMNIEQEKKAHQRQNALDQKRDLDKQVAYHQRMAENERLAVKMEKAAAELVEAEFRERVQRQLDEVEANKPKQYKHLNRNTGRPF
eukprot:TRINITY_DN95018_c0_g1_i1.p1 TRINITY_DN95018_c0_g1~~TRINITY_DN95018_c0_g1_i1.p1  ORF type:complete len:486 (+),score=83.12 TRINITY_DN95018_c0_g1_i1:42-1499(+)